MRNQRNKNITLLIIAGCLLACSIVLSFTGEYSTSTLENTGVFSVADTSRVDQITIEAGAEKILLKKNALGWTLNEKENAEKNIVRVLLAVLKDMEVVRLVPDSRVEDITDYIMEEGKKITVSGQNQVLQQFLVAGNENKTITYMMAESQGTPMVVNIPGYDSYVAGIFEIPANDWRDRTVMDTNWRTLKKLEIAYAQFPEYNVSIEFRNTFLTVEGIEKLDTAKMMGYINQFYQLQADKFIYKDSNPIYDSLAATPTTVSISIEDIRQDNSKTINFYPIVNDEPMMLAHIEEDDQLVLFEAARIQGLFGIKSDFERKEN